MKLPRQLAWFLAGKRAPRQPFFLRDDDWRRETERRRETDDGDLADWTDYSDGRDKNRYSMGKWFAKKGDGVEMEPDRKRKP